MFKWWKAKNEKLKKEYEEQLIVHNELVGYEKKIKHIYKIPDVRVVYRKVTEFPRFTLAIFSVIIGLLGFWLYDKTMKYDLLVAKVLVMEKDMAKIKGQQEKIALSKVKADVRVFKREINAEVNDLRNRLREHETPAKKNN